MTFSKNIQAVLFFLSFSFSFGFGQTIDLLHILDNGHEYQDVNSKGKTSQIKKNSQKSKKKVTSSIFTSILQVLKNNKKAILLVTAGVGTLFLLKYLPMNAFKQEYNEFENTSIIPEDKQKDTTPLPQEENESEKDRNVDLNDPLASDQSALMLSEEREKTNQDLVSEKTPNPKEHTSWTDKEKGQFLFGCAATMAVIALNYYFNQ